MKSEPIYKLIPINMIGLRSQKNRSDLSMIDLVNRERKRKQEIQEKRARKKKWRYEQKKQNEKLAAEERAIRELLAPPIPKKKHKPICQPRLPNIDRQLNRFWAVLGANRIGLLKQFAEICVGKPKWKLRRKFISAGWKKYGGYGQMCFVCTEKADIRHHIIQIQHGGDNRPHNVVCLCNSCHAKIHPWLIEAKPKEPTWEAYHNDKSPELSTVHL